MPVTVDALRALGARRVTLRTQAGEFTGFVAQREIPDAAVMVMFASDAAPQEPLVVALGDIEEIVER